MLSIMGESFDVSLEFQLSMTVAAHRSFEMFVQRFSDRVFHLKTNNVRLAATKAASGIAHLLPA
jgi:hypothetical protein